MVSVLFILDKVELTEDQSEFILSAIQPGGTWELIASDGTRDIFDAVIPSEEVVAGMVAYFQPRNPVIVGIWTEVGKLTTELNLTEYQQLTGTTQEVHQYAGWAKREGFIEEMYNAN